MGFYDRNRQYHSTYGTVNISLGDFKEVTSAGAVGSIAAIGGNLASDTTPIYGAEATTEAQVLTWAAGNSDIVQANISLPADFSGKDDCYLDLTVRTDNAGGAGIEAATFSCLTSWDNGAQVTDACTDTTPSETAHTNTATIAAADVPDSASFLNLQLVAGTHANDPVRLLGARLRYVRKLS